MGKREQSDKSSLGGRERGYTVIMNFMLKTITRNSRGEITTVATSCKGLLKEKEKLRDKEETGRDGEKLRIRD